MEIRSFLVQHPGEVVLLGVGPMTNLGVLFASDPALPGLLRAVVLMCGRFFEGEGGESNAIGDPHAAAVVYGNTTHGRPPRHLSFGLDVTTRCRLDAGVCRRRLTAPVLEPVRDFAEVRAGQAPFRRGRQVVFNAFAGPEVTVDEINGLFREAAAGQLRQGHRGHPPAPGRRSSPGREDRLTPG